MNNLGLNSLGVDSLNIVADALNLNRGIGRFKYVGMNKESKAYAYTFRITDSLFRGVIRIKYNNGAYLVNGIYLLDGGYRSNNERWTRTEFDNIIATIYVVLESLYKEYKEAVKVESKLSDNIMEQLKGFE